MSTQPIDYKTPEGMVRLYTADVGLAQYLTDEQVSGYLAANGGDARLAAAEALESIAVSELLVGKVITTQDLQTNAAALAEAMRKLAAGLRARARENAADQAGDDYAFDVVGGIPSDPFGRSPELVKDPDRAWLVSGM